MNSKRMLLLIALLSLCFNVVSGCSSNKDTSNDFPAAEAVEIADPGLEEAIREALVKSEGELTVGDLAELEELRAHTREITDLSGLEYAVNLRILDLYRNRISDLSPIGGLTVLEILKLGDNNIKDLSPLSGMSGLRELNLMENQIRNLSVVEWENLSFLEALDLRYNYLRLSDPDTAQIVESLRKTVGNFQVEPTY